MIFSQIKIQKLLKSYSKVLSYVPLFFLHFILELFFTLKGVTEQSLFHKPPQEVTTILFIILSRYSDYHPLVDLIVIVLLSKMFHRFALHDKVVYRVVST